MAFTNPPVPAKLESDLALCTRWVSARWVDSSGQEHSLSGVRLEYRPYLVGCDGADRISVPLGAVISIAVDDDYVWWPQGDSEPTLEPLVVSRWHRARWGELIRFRPE